MRKIIFASFLFSAVTVGCGESECDKFESCCDAVSGDVAGQCTVPDGADDDACRDGREAFVAIIEASNQDVPSECTD